MAQTAVETGLPGKPRTGTSPRRPNSSGLPGRIAIFQKSSSQALAAERLLDEVVVADRGAAGGDQQIEARRPRARAPPAPRRRRRRCRDRPASAPQAGASPPSVDGVGADDLAALRRLAGPAQLVAGGEEADARPPPHGQPEMAHRGGEAQRPRVEQAARGEPGPAAAKSSPAGAHEGAGRHRAGEPDPCRRSASAFSWITIASAPAGTAPPVKMRTASPGPTATVQIAARRGLADDAERPADLRGVGGAHGIAVHGRDRHRRLVAPRHADPRRARGPAPAATATHSPGSGRSGARMRACASATGSISGAPPGTRRSGRRPCARGGCR